MRNGTTPPVIDEILAIDLIALRSASGEGLDVATHRLALEKSLSRSEVVTVRRAGRLVAYAYLWPEERPGHWFAGGISIDPRYRNAGVVSDLASAVLALLSDRAVAEVRSHVRRDNTASIRLHHCLRFEVEKQSDQAIAFVASTAAIRTALAALVRVKD